MVTQLEGRKKAETSFLPVPRCYFVTGPSYDQLLEQLDTSLQNWFALICICMVGGCQRDLIAETTVTKVGDSNSFLNMINLSHFLCLSLLPSFPSFLPNPHPPPPPHTHTITHMVSIVVQQGKQKPPKYLYKKAFNPGDWLQRWWDTWEISDIRKNYHPKLEGF